MSCSKCNNTGKVPFKRKDGSIVPFAWVFCGCREEPEHYYSIKPSDFDFPCSYAFRSFVERECTGKPLPPLEPPEQVSTPPMAPPEPEWTQRQWQYVQQMRGMVNHLNNKISEIRADKLKEHGEY